MDDIYSELFGEVGFTNLRANNIYESTLITTSQNKGWGVGIHLASVARSHKLKGKFYSKTTEAYLTNVNKDGDVDEIMYSLFERGIFGFIPYQLLILLQGEQIRELKIKEQNVFLKEMNLSAVEVGSLVKNTQLNIKKYNTVVKELCKLKRDEIKGY